MSEPNLSARAASRLRPALVVLAVLCAWLASAPRANADGDLVVSTRGATDTRVVISSERGGRQVEEDTDGDGVVSIRPNAGAGTYQIEITAGGVTESSTIEVPQIGTLAIQFAGDAAEGSRITSETISRVEVITVTGLKHEQTLQDASASIQALTEETLEAMGADDFVDYARNVPSLNFADLGPNRSEINLRGMGKLSAGNATVGVYIDDIAVANSFNNPDLKLFDVERIEVLRGPQGTLYGEASMGGAIRLLTHPADPAGLAYKLEAGGSDTHGGDGENWNGSGMINLPAPRDKFGVRLVGYVRDEEGWIDNPILGLEDLNHAETEGGRLSTRWFAGESSILTLTGTAQSIDAGGQPFTTEVIDLGDGTVIPLGDLEQFTQIPESDKEDLNQVVANFDHIFPWAELTVIGGWIDREYDRDIDFGIPVDFTSDQKIVSGEARLADSGAKTVWVTGLYYKKLDEDNALVSPDLGGPGVDFGNFIFFNTEDTSLFGEATRLFSEKWSGTLGARIFDEDKHDPFIQTFGGFVFDETDLRSSASGVLPKLGLTYDASEHFKLYAIGAEGYRSGGVNPIISQNPEAPATYDEDSNRSFELGLKSGTSTGKLIFNAALFRVDWEDMQISGTPINPALGFTTNAGDAHTQGLELELTTRPLAGFDVTVGGSLMEAELDDAAEGGDAGNRLPHTVEEQFSVSAQYRFPLTATMGLMMRGDVQYRGDAFSDVRNRPVDETDAYTLGNLNIGLELRRFEVTAFWRNIGDERAELVRFQDGNQVYRNQPETIGILFRVNG